MSLFRTQAVPVYAVTAGKADLKGVYARISMHFPSMTTEKSCANDPIHLIFGTMKRLENKTV
jgi:hypothetical protein